MGVLAATMRLMYLTTTKNDLEFKMMNITEKMSALSAQVAECEEFCGDLDPESPNVKALEIERITGIDRRRCDKLIDKLVDMGFVDGVDNKLNKDIITVSINGLHQFKTMCEGLDEDDVASLRDMIGDKYFVDYYKKFKNQILEKKKVPPNDVP